MNKYLFLLCVFGTTAFCAAQAQDDADGGLFIKPPASTVSGDVKKNPDAAIDAAKKNPGVQKAPTEITATKEASFDTKQRMAVFLGAVHVKDPQFTLDADKLTVYFKQPAQTGGAKDGDGKNVTNKPTDNKISASSVVPQGGGLERVIAEGNVTVTSDRPDSNGGPPVHYLGKGAKVEYYATTGEAILYGWPQVQQGINTIVATEESTVIHLFSDGRMKIVGQHKVNINDPGPDKSPETK